MALRCHIEIYSLSGHKEGLPAPRRISKKRSVYLLLGVVLQILFYSLHDLVVHCDVVMDAPKFEKLVHVKREDHSHSFQEM